MRGEDELMEEWVNKLQTGYGTVFRNIDPSGALLDRAIQVGTKYIEDFSWLGVPTPLQENITAVILGEPIHLPFDNSRKGRGELAAIVDETPPASAIRSGHAFQPGNIPGWFKKIYDTMIDEMSKGKVNKMLKGLDPTVVKQVQQEILDLKRYKPYLYYSSWCYMFANSNRAKTAQRLRDTEAGSITPARPQYTIGPKFWEKWQDDNKSENETSEWYGILLKEDSPTKQLYNLVREEMHKPDIHSIEDLMKKVEAHGFDPMPTKEQVQKVLGYILTRGRIK